MEDFGDILYVLAVLAALVFSAFKKQKQANKKKPVFDEDESDYDPMGEDDVLSELKELFQPKAKETPLPKEEKVVKEEPLFIQNQKSVEIKKEPVIKEEIKIVDLKETDESGFDKEQIDLRQAVIYSEILKRPYE